MALTSTRATEILMEDGKAVGVKVENRSGSYNIRAKKVIIATGGSTYDTDTDAEFGKDAEHLVAYDEASGLYAIYLSPTSLGTIGGAITGETFHVMNTEDKPIDNLFAVGECATSTLFGDYYVGSFSLGLYTAAGKTAAETARRWARNNG